LIDEERSQNGGHGSGRADLQRRLISRGEGRQRLRRICGCDDLATTAASTLDLKRQSISTPSDSAAAASDLRLR
jgi:hypothetical protein